MSRPSIVEFTKMHGAGNDFLVLDNRAYRFDDALSDLAATWCPRRYGVGADGLLALDDAEQAAYRMRYVNADGSWATMCGNGARCLALYAHRVGIEENPLSFETDAGRYRARVLEDGSVRLYVPTPTRLALDVDLENPKPDGLGPVHFVHTGTEHLVAFVDALDDLPVEAFGRALRNDAAVQPAGANANFVAVEDGVLTVRTYEKGVEAETPSCGTGVLAAAAIAAATSRVRTDHIRVETRGGTLFVGTEEADRGQKTYLEGPVATVYEGRLSLD